MNKTILNVQEKKWITEQRITRLTDKKEVLIYPMGAERYLSSVLSGRRTARYNIRADIENKRILVIPGYGNSAFLFAQAGAKSVTVYDKDPVTIAWIKAFKKYFHYRGAETKTGKAYPSIGELLTALTCWYPPLIKLPTGQFHNAICWAINPQLLRQTYIYHMLSLVRQAIQTNTHKDFELDKDIQFYAGELNQINTNNKNPPFDTAFVPYLLGVRNGIEKEKDIIDFIKQLTQLVPAGHILVNPARNTKEFYFTGQRYFITTPYSTILAIPELKNYTIHEDKQWFKTQGLAVFGNIVNINASNDVLNIRI